MNIQRLLIDFYSKNKDKKIVQFMNKVYSREFKIPYDYFARKRLEKIKNKHNNQDRKIKVCFIVNDPNVWNKLEAVYEEMKEDGHFELYMVCVSPPFSDDVEEAYKFFKGKGYDCVNAYYKDKDGKERVYDIKKLAPDYIFYGQPYNNYLPKAYRTYKTSKYAKLCIMQYGMTVSRLFLNIQSRNFYRDIYKFYSMVKEEIEYRKEKFPILYERNLQSAENLGFPAFSQFMKEKGKPSKSFEFSKNDFKAIWTPRWVTDEKLGGSNFFKYKDVLFSYAENNKDVDILFRPHPMALDNFIKTGEMTQEQVDEFKGKCRRMPNISLDEEKEYATSFWTSDVLISDISSIVVEYFITGKPIIYCIGAGSENEYLEYFRKILSCSYIVENETQLCETISKIKNGEDPLKEQRITMIEELFGDTLTSAPRKITDSILHDYYE